MTFVVIFLMKMVMLVAGWHKVRESASGAHRWQMISSRNEFLSRKFMITHLSIAFEDLLGSSIAPQVMTLYIEDNFFKLGT